MLIELIALALPLVFVYRYFWCRSTLPPGPFRWPLIGNLFQMDEAKPHVTMYEWSKQYGPVFTVWMGVEPTVVIADYETMKDALTRHGDQLSSRPPFFALEHFSKGPYGLVLSSGEAWKEQSRFSLHTLKNFGLGRNLMEEKIQNETKLLVASIREDVGSERKTVTKISAPINLCVGSIISSILFGNTYEKGNERFGLLMKTLEENLELLMSPQLLLLNSFPWLRRVPLFGHFGFDELGRQNTIFKQFFNWELDNHKEALKKNKNNDEPKDFSEAYLKEMERREREGIDMSHFSEWQLLITVEELWFAGIKTTAVTLLWMILAMVKYPRIQQKIHDEIDAVLGRDKAPTMDDRQSMPYIMDTINEGLRWGNVTPINFYHSNDTDFQLGGYTIPKGMAVIPQIACLTVDEKIFPSPDEFRPERFLEDDGKTLRKVDQFAPFSLGKRQCMGEVLARAGLFLIFANLLQKFQFSVAPGQGETTTEPTASYTSAPQDYEYLVKLR